MLDLGCGEGHALKFFREHGVRVIGVDGMPQDDPDIVLHDFAAGHWYPARGGGLSWVDLVWTCEFVEHVEECYLPNVTASIIASDLVLMTHAFPGQPGYHHVNCRDSEYWKGVMAALGFSYDHALTVATRELSKLNEDPNNHYSRSGLVFKRTR